MGVPTVGQYLRLPKQFAKLLPREGVLIGEQGRINNNNAPYLNYLAVDIGVLLPLQVDGIAARCGGVHRLRQTVL